MRFVVLLSALLFTGVAFASFDIPVTKVTHNVNSLIGVRTGHAGKIYYNCDSTERRVVDILEQLGATNIDIRCRGGFDPHGITTLARISGNFDSYVRSAEGEMFRDFVRINLRDRQNCALMAELLTVFKDNFVIENATGFGSRVSSTCRSDRRYNVTLDIVQ